MEIIIEYLDICVLWPWGCGAFWKRKIDYNDTQGQMIILEQVMKNVVDSGRAGGRRECDEDHKH